MHRRSQAVGGDETGFTLIEIMVVLIIIGVMTAMVTLSIGDNRDKKVEQEARRLQALLRLAADESIIRARPLGIDVSVRGYRFLESTPDAASSWQPMTGDREFRARHLPDFIDLTILGDGTTPRLVNAGDRGKVKDANESAGPLPQALLLPSGEITPFRIVVRGSGLRTHWLVEGHRDGKITVQRER